MTLRLIQLDDGIAAASDGTRAWRVKGAATIHALASAAIAAKATLAGMVEQAGRGEDIDLLEALNAGRILSPASHPDPARIFLTGTGLTHLGSADARDRMHAKAHAADATDSMKMFRLGLEGGKPAQGETGVQPEWFYKGDGRSIVAPEQPLPSPDFALDGGEEPEIAGIYLIAADGTPFRLGFALANEFSDHVTERTNYLYLAHSKLRPASLGPELLTGELARRHPGPRARAARRAAHLGKAVPHRRSEHVASHRQSGAPSLQIRAVPPAGRPACAFLRHGDAVLLGRRQGARRRRLRDRSAAFRAAAAQSFADSAVAGHDGKAALNDASI